MADTSPLLGGQPKHTSKWRSVNLIALACFFRLGSLMLLNVPLTQLVENNLCRHYFWSKLEAGVEEGICKNDHLQAELAYITGSLIAIDGVASLITAIPCGVLSDNIGRKPILFLGAIGNVLSMTSQLIVLAFPDTFPASAVLVGPLFLLLAGGINVNMATIFTMASDLTEGPDKTSAFFMIEFGGLIGSCGAPAVASALMQASSPWIPAILSVIITPCFVVPLFFVPETLPPTKRQSAMKAYDKSGTSSFGLHTTKSLLSESFHHLKDSLTSLKNPIIGVIIAIAMIRAPEFVATNQLFPQYVSKRFGWTLAETGYLRTMRGVVQMVVLLGILPASSNLLLRWQTPSKSDLLLARLSFVISAMGALWMAGSSVGVAITGLAIQSLAVGWSPLLRSFANNFIPVEDTSKMNILISVMESAGSLFAGPALAGLFEIGMERGGVSIGLPYFGLAGISFLCLVGLLCIRAPSRKKKQREIPQDPPIESLENSLLLEDC